MIENDTDGGEWAASMFEESVNETIHNDCSTKTEDHHSQPQTMHTALEKVCCHLEHAAAHPMDELDLPEASRRCDNYHKLLRAEVDILEKVDIALDHLARRFRSRESASTLDHDLVQETVEATKLRNPHRNFLAEVWSHHMERGLLVLYKV